MTTLKPLLGTVLLLGGVGATLVLDRMEALGPMPVVVAQAPTQAPPILRKPATPPVVTPVMRTELEAEVAKLEVAEAAFMAARQHFNEVLGRYHVPGYRLNPATLRYVVDPYYVDPVTGLYPKENK